MVIRAAALSADGLSLLTGTRRFSVVRVNSRAITEGEPEATAAAALPHPFDEQIEMSLHAEGGQLRFVRRTATGTAIGEPTALGRIGRAPGHRPPAVLEWTGEHFVALWVERDGSPPRIWARRAHCTLTSP